MPNDVLTSCSVLVYQAFDTGRRILHVGGSTSPAFMVKCDADQRAFSCPHKQSNQLRNKQFTFQFIVVKEGFSNGLRWRAKVLIRSWDPVPRGLTSLPAIVATDEDAGVGLQKGLPFWNDADFCG